MSVDAVIADFIAGATEWLCPANEPDHWDLIEGQGSLFHASYAGVSLGLLHGAQAEALVMCHEPGRPHMRSSEELEGPDGRVASSVAIPLPDLAECIALNERCARLTHPAARVVGIACNTSALDEAAARALLDRLAAAHGMPAVDPVRTGVAPIVDRLV